MSRGPSVPVERCLRCGNDTVHGRGSGLRHRIQLVDVPDAPDGRGGRGGASLWGQLCPACWTAVRRFVAGAATDETPAPPPRAGE